MLTQGSLYNSQCLPEKVKLVIAINMTYTDSMKSVHAVTELHLEERIDVQPPILSY